MSYKNGINAFGVSNVGNTGGATGIKSNASFVMIASTNITISQSTGTNNIHSVYFSAGAGGGGGADGVNILAAGTQTANTTGSVLFSNANGVSFGMNNSSVITATVQTNYLTTARASNDAVGLNTAQTNVTWTVNSAGISLNAGGYLTTARASNDAIGLATAQTNVTWTVNSAGLSLNAGAYLTSQSAQTQNVAVPAASNTTYTSGTVVFTGSNNITVSYNGQTIQISGPTTAAQTNQTLGLYAVSNTTLSTSGTVDARTLSFQGAGIASVGVSNGSVVISVPSGGGGGDGYNILAAGTQTANTTGTVVFLNSNGITFGMSDNSVITASVNAGGGAAGSMSYYEPYQWLTGQNMAGGSLLLQPIYVPANIVATQGDILAHISNSASAGGSITVLLGLYTYSGSTANSVSTASYTFGYNSTAAASSYTNVSGTRFWSQTLASWDVTAGQYLQAVMVSSLSSGTSGTISIFGRTANGLNQPLFAAAGSTFTSWGQGYYNSTTGAFPASIHISRFVQTGSTAPRQPWIRLIGTV